MTDKQIIIDGVDVCRCRYYDDRYGYCDACRDDIDGNSYTKCMYKDDCYYKQLKRKEQECEELKSDNLQEVGQLKFAIGTLTAENLHLKELLDMRIEALCDSCKAGSMLPIKCRIYEKTLTEIKEIAEPYNDMSGNCVIVNCFEDMYKILQKISECEGNDET